jgi:hypothetical protein
VDAPEAVKPRTGVCAAAVVEILAGSLGRSRCLRYISCAMSHFTERI